ncbi:MAG: uracil phosphoribosyltransferase [Cryomorphaceae bacterium MED-G11]|nr:MAG: uracil phosphoribosyltransferase [Cryomorphaceae bacterium MED-G11]
MVKDFFNSVAWLFQEVFFLPFDLLRTIQLDSWFLANIVSWFFITIGIAGATYWIKKLKEFDDNDEEDKDNTSHSFL